MSSFDFHSHSAPVQDYETAIGRIQAMQAGELATPGFNPELQTILLTHGRKAKKAVLWLHGYTSAALQFKSLAELCHQKGFNALVPCIPHHGYKDRLCSEVSKIKAAELVRFTDEVSTHRAVAAPEYMVNMCKTAKNRQMFGNQMCR
jgi:alpha-beta hydrolase superfamily lysophospholipase